MHKQINRETCQQDPNIRIEIVNTEKHEHSNQIETQSNSNRNTGQTLTQEEIMNVENKKKMMSEKKTT